MSFVYFGNYLRISVSVGTSAKCRSYKLPYSKLIHFFQNQSNLFISDTQFFHGMLYLLSKIVFYGVQKLKGKCVFRKIEIIHVQNIISSVAHKQNSVGFSNLSCKLALLSKVSYQKSRIASSRAIRILKD